MPVTALTPILNVSDFAASVAWFERLGWRKCWDWGEPPSFGAVGSGAAEIFLCLDGQGARGGTRPRHYGDDVHGAVWMSWWLESPAEVDALHARASALGYEVLTAPCDEPWRVREFQLRHPDGHVFRVSAGLERCDEAVAAG